jgi:cystathionine beta-lyase
VEAFVREQVPFVNVIKPEGTYLSWLDVGEALNKTGSTASAASDESMTPEGVFQHYLVEHANIHINPGSNYGIGGAGRMRMNIATSRQLVELALNNMANALKSA